MGFKNNGDGTRTWTNSTGTQSYTRDSSGRLINRTSTSYDGRHSTSVNYSNGKVSTVSRTHNGVTRTKKGW